MSSKGWIRNKADEFRDLLSRTCCACFEAIPSIGLMVLAIVLLLLLLACVPLAIMLTYMAPEALNSTELLDTQPFSAIRRTKGGEWPLMHDDFMDEFILLRSTKLVPVNVTSCANDGFSCTNPPGMVIGNHQRCDGVNDCIDGSDELDCKSCKTSFSCAVHPNSNRYRCLRGFQLCDGKSQCADSSDEVVHCDRRSCDADEFGCKDRSGQNFLCFPHTMKCDGDAQCPMGEDEMFCTECQNGAKFCKATSTCIPKWKLCDGVANCPDESDERNCNCYDCSNANNALCLGGSGTCIRKSQVCDGFSNCPDNEDEANCPGSCTATSNNIRAFVHRHVRNVASRREEELNNNVDSLKVIVDRSVEESDEEIYNKSVKVASFKSAFDDGPAAIEISATTLVRCSDNKIYYWRYACAGLLPQCDGSCKSCNKELSFQCSDKSRCIHRSFICDGIAQCSDRSDEKNCDCSQAGMQTCAAKTETGQVKCFSEENRCDGFNDCPDGEDETNCDKCSRPSFHCASERRCIASTSRCDGRPNCSTGEDEENCSCAECKSHPFAVYMCQDSSHCFRQDEVCNPYTRCPKPTVMDKLYCATRGKPYF